jgi:hypothetical protein
LIFDTDVAILFRAIHECRLQNGKRTWSRAKTTHVEFDFVYNQFGEVVEV